MAPEPLFLSVTRGTRLKGLEAVEIGPIPNSHVAEHFEALLTAYTTMDILIELEGIVSGYNTVLNGLGVRSDPDCWLEVHMAKTPTEPPTRLGPLPSRAVQSAARSLLVTLDEAEDLVEGTERLVTAYARAVRCAVEHDHSTHDRSS
ncbi:MAG: hypothetical protein F4X74_10625 [Acidimicrobiia bacterium]|nr:hypothetical protein [Acidimicrobiia bacterium]